MARSRVDPLDDIGPDRFDWDASWDTAGRSRRRRERPLTVASLLVAFAAIVAAVVTILTRDQGAAPAADPGVTAIVYVADVSGSERSETERSRQIANATALGGEAIERRIPFVAMVAGGTPADTQVVTRVDASRLSCDGRDACEQVEAEAQAALALTLDEDLSLAAVPPRSGSPVGEAHADASRIARLAGHGPGGVLIWDSDMEQATLGPNGELGGSDDPPRVWLEHVTEYTADQAAADVAIVRASAPADMSGLHNIYLSVANRGPRPPDSDTEEGRSLDRAALWTFARALCDASSSRTCLPALDVQEAIEIIHTIDEGS